MKVREGGQVERGAGCGQWEGVGYGLSCQDPWLTLAMQEACLPSPDLQLARQTNPESPRSRAVESSMSMAS